jgi:tRNA-modifying protein YgfZ
MSIVYSVILDRSIIQVKGLDTYKYIQGLVSNDINQLSKDNSLYTLFFNAQGRYLYDAFIYYLEANNIIMDIPSSKSTEVLNRLNMHKLKSNVEIKDISGDYRIISILGQNAYKEFSLPYKIGATTNKGNIIVAFDPRTILMGLRCVINNEEYDSFVKGYVLDQDCYEQTRIDSLIPEGAKDLIYEKSLPLEYGMDKFNAISFSKGCYVGQELTTRTKSVGVIRKVIAKITSDKELPALGTEIYSGNNKIGIVCSSYQNKGLALIRLDDYNNRNQELPIIANTCDLKIIIL